MKRITWLGSAVVLGVAARWLVSCSSGPTGGTVTAAMARWHFAGAASLQSQTAAPALASILSGTNSAPTGDRLATNLVRVLWQRLGRPDETNATAVLAPLMHDVLRYESAGEVAATGWRVTVKLPLERWPLWQQARGTLAAISPHAPGAILTYTNGWLTTGAGAVAGSGWLTLSNGTVLAAEGDLAKIFEGVPAHWPRARLGVNLDGGKVLTQASLDFSAPPLGALPAWKLPERMAHGPFSQFMAVRGVAEIGSRLDWWRDAFAGQAPDQVFVWSQPEVPFRNWVAVPSKDPAGDVERWFAAAGKVFSSAAGRSGRAVMGTNRTAFAILDTLKGLQPVVSPVKQGNDTFLLASLYPADRTTNAISGGMRRLLAESNVVYADAEFTPEAIDHWNVLFQLNQILQSRMPNARNARGHSWMFENRAVLGDSETVVRQATPTRFSVERKSSAGITGFELVLLTRWLDGTDNRLRHVGLPATPPDTAPAAKP